MVSDGFWGSQPWWYRLTTLRHAYPSVPPWEWEKHPEWANRVIIAHNAEIWANQEKAKSGK